MALKELRLPVLTNAEVQGWNAVLTQGGARVFTYAGREWHLRVHAPDETSPSEEGLSCISLKIDGEAAALLAPDAFFDTWLSTLTGGEPVRGLPQNIALAVFEVLFGTLSTLTSSLLGRHLALDPAPFSPPAGALPFLLDWTLTPPEGAPTRGLLRLSAGALAPLADVLGLSHPAPLPFWSDFSPSSLRLVLPGPSLTVQEVASLEAGDVVLLPAGSDAHPVLAAGTRILARLRRTQDHYIVEEVLPMSKDISSPANDLSGLDALPVDIAFDAGGARLTLAELRGLQPGQVLDTGRDLRSGTVKMTANGAIIGEGVLVEIEGRLGVMISRLFPPTGDTHPEGAPE